MSTGKRTWIWWSALPPVIALAFLAIWWWSALPLARVDLGNGRTARVYGATTWDQMQPLDIEVLDNGRIAVCRTSWAISHPENHPLHFRVHASPDGKVVALTEGAAPQIVVLMHDFERHETWPVWRSEDESWEERERRGRRMLARFGDASELRLDNGGDTRSPKLDVN